MGDCVFCDRIAAGDVDEDWGSVVLLTPRSGGVVPGHIMVIPKVHVEDAVESPNIFSYTMYFASHVAAQYDHSNIITNIGAAASQTIWHLHVHVIPREHGDGLLLPWS